MYSAPSRPLTKEQLADKVFMANYHKEYKKAVREILIMFFSLITFAVVGMGWAMYERQQLRHDLFEPYPSTCTHNHR